MLQSSGYNESREREEGLGVGERKICVETQKKEGKKGRKEERGVSWSSKTSTFLGIGISLGVGPKGKGGEDHSFSSKGGEVDVRMRPDLGARGGGGGSIFFGQGVRAKRGGGRLRIILPVPWRGRKVYRGGGKRKGGLIGKRREAWPGSKIARDMVGCHKRCVAAQRKGGKRGQCKKRSIRTR